MRYRADGFKAEGRRQRAEVKCTPLNRETLYSKEFTLIGYGLLRSRSVCIARIAFSNQSK